jgi:predicted lipid carrier protein YhbT
MMCPAARAAIVGKATGHRSSLELDRPTMADATAKFFADLAERGDDTRLRKVTGVLRFDIVHDDQIDYWVVAADNDGLVVSHRDTPQDSDCVLRTDTALFERMARGEENATAAMLRGAMTVEGQLELVLLLFQRMLPDAPRSDGRPEDSVVRSSS